MPLKWQSGESTLLARQKYGWDIDSRLLLDEINACEEDVMTAWE
jgi:hypothetical protein